MTMISDRLTDEQLAEILSGVVDGMEPTTQELAMATELQELRKQNELQRGELLKAHITLLNQQKQIQKYRNADSAEPDYIRYDCGCCGWETIEDWRENDACPKCNHKPMGKTELYTAPPASEREQIRRDHAEWSDKTFGDVGPIGPLKHLSKEALEAAANPEDPLEWADMQFLLWDAQRRMGLSDEFITRAMIEKLAINKARQWPEPKDGEPRLHIKEQPAPVVPDGLRQALSNAGIAAPESDEMLAATCEKYIQMLVTWVKDRKPFQPAPVVPEEMPKGLATQIVSLLTHNISDKLLAQKIWNACRAAMFQSKYRDLSQPIDPQVAEYEKIMLQAGNSPENSDG